MSALLSKYNTFMQVRPLLGVCMSPGVCYGAGDYLAQHIEKSQGKRNITDVRRFLGFTAFGGVLAGPIYHMWFNKLKNVPSLIEKLVKYNETRYLSRQFQNQIHKAMENNTKHEFQDISYTISDKL